MQISRSGPRVFLAALSVIFALCIVGANTNADLIDCSVTPDNVLCKTLASEATGLPTGCRPVTADEIKIDPRLEGRQVCPGDVAAGITGDVGAAKAYLKSLPKKPLSSCAPPNDQNIERLNSKFSVCAANFFKAYTQRYSGVVITSAFRDGQPGTAGDGSGKSANSCAGGASGSNHMLGLAIDVYPADGNFPQIWNFARANPQFGVCFPYLAGDRPHMATAGFNTAEAAACARQGVRPCEGGGIVDPVRDASVATSPSSSITSAIRNYLNPQQQQMCTLPDGKQVPCSAIANSGSVPQQVIPQASQPQFQSPPPAVGTTINATPYTAGTCAPQFYCVNNAYYYRSSSCVDRLYQQCPAGCSTSRGGCISGTSTLSVFDQIGLIAEPTTTAVVTPTAPLILTVGSGDAITLQQNPTQTGNIPPPSNSYTPPSYIPQQTFTSGDLRKTPAQQYSPQELSVVQRTLATMKDTLLRVLAYLRPFGRPSSQSSVIEYVEGE